jgi:hypothetical protein
MIVKTLLIKRASPLRGGAIFNRTARASAPGEEFPAIAGFGAMPIRSYGSNQALAILHDKTV